MENRRVNRRFKLHQMVGISSNNEEVFISATGIDISLGGMQCTLSNQVQTGSDIFLMFEIPNGEENHVIKCYGDVIRQDKNETGYQLGITFKHLDNSDKTVLQGYLDSLE